MEINDSDGDRFIPRETATCCQYHSCSSQMCSWTCCTCGKNSIANDYSDADLQSTAGFSRLCYRRCVRSSGPHLKTPDDPDKKCDHVKKMVMMIKYMDDSKAVEDTRVKEELAKYVGDTHRAASETIPRRTDEDIIEAIKRYIKYNFIDKHLQWRPEDFNIISGTTLLWQATRLCRIGLIEFLIKEGATINTPDNDGQTPLMNAVVQVAGLHDGPKALRPGWIDERRKLVEHLVEKQKADMEVKDNGGATALFLALQEGMKYGEEDQPEFFRIANYLIWHGADVRSIADSNPEFACRYFAQHLRLVPICRDYKVDYGSGQFIGHYPLMKGSIVVETLRPSSPTRTFIVKVETLNDDSTSSSSVDVPMTTGPPSMSIGAPQKDSDIGESVIQAATDGSVDLMEVKRQLALALVDSLFREEPQVATNINTESVATHFCLIESGKALTDSFMPMNRRYTIILDVCGKAQDIKSRIINKNNVDVHVEIHDDPATPILRRRIAQRVADKSRERIEELTKEELSCIWVDHWDMKKGGDGWPLSGWWRTVSNIFSPRPSSDPTYADPKVNFFLLPIPIGLNFLEVCCVSAMAERDWSAFNNVVVSAAVDHYWDKTRNFFWLTIVFELIYRSLLSFTIYTFHDYVQSRNDHLRKFSKGVVVVIIIMTIASAVSLVSNVWHLAQRKRWQYLRYSLMFYVIDAFAVTAMIVAMFKRCSSWSTSDGVTGSSTALSVATVFVWLKSLYYMRPFPWTGYLVKCISHVIQSTVSFMFVLLIITIAFSQALYLLSYENDSIAFHNWIGAALSAYEYMLGYGDWDFSGTTNPPLARFLMVAFTWIAAIVLLNLLIALMNDAFVEIRTSTKSSASMERAIVVLDQQWANELFIGAASRLQRHCCCCWPFNRIIEAYMRFYDVQDATNLGDTDKDQNEVALCIRRQLDCRDEEQRAAQEALPNRTLDKVHELERSLQEQREEQMQLISDLQRLLQQQSHPTLLCEDGGAEEEKKLGDDGGIEGSASLRGDEWAAGGGVRRL